MSTRARAITASIIAFAAAIAVVAMDFGVTGRAVVIAGVCLSLWLTGWVPVWVPTVVLWIATPLLIAGLDARFTPIAVVRWSVDPVLALFLGGFALAAAAKRQGIDSDIAAFALRRAGTSATRLVAAAAIATALLSMWMSNVAAAAMMLNAFRPIWDREPPDSSLRRSLLLAIALAADVGGVATPIGTGANGIAMAAVEHAQRIGFVQWMSFGVPLAVGLVGAVVALVIGLHRPTLPAAMVSASTTPVVSAASLARRGPRTRLTVVFCVTIALWLSEPLHGVPAWTVALGAVVALLALGLLRWTDVRQLDWATLMLVAGGIALGALLERSGVVRELASQIPLFNAPMTLRLLALCVLAATFSALMSNTGTAALLIPLAASIDPAPSTAIIIAIACSLGVPFVISTPPNALAVAGGLRSSDLLKPGLVIMIVGCVLVALTGPLVLRMVGIP